MVYEKIVLSKDFVEGAERRYAVKTDKSFAFYGFLNIEGKCADYCLMACGDEKEMHYRLDATDRATGNYLGMAITNTPYGLYEFKGNKLYIQKEAE